MQSIRANHNPNCFEDLKCENIMMLTEAGIGNPRVVIIDLGYVPSVLVILVVTNIPFGLAEVVED